MQAFTIKTNKSDYPFLVIADGFKSAVEVLYQKGIYDTDIVFVQQMEAVKSDHILIEERLTDKEVLREEVRHELHKDEEKQDEQKPTNKCEGCNNAKGCVACVDGSEWAHIEIADLRPYWSKEDESNLQGIIDEIEANKHSAPDYDLATYDRFLSWLKSLKDRFAWMPNDEQIKFCKEVYADLLSAKGFDVGAVNSELNRLEEQLKKLREE